MTLPKTRHILLMNLAILFGSYSLEFIQGFISFEFSNTRRVLEVFSYYGSWFSILASFVLIPIAIFRPYQQFQIKGDCRARLCNLGLAVSPFIVYTMTIIYVVMGLQS